MNSEICFDACRNIYGKSSSTFWGIFIKIPKLIPRVATVVSTLLQNWFATSSPHKKTGSLKYRILALTWCVHKLRII